MATAKSTPKTICATCDQDMATASSCLDSAYRIGGRVYVRDTTGYDASYFGDDGDRCMDCGIVNEPGHFHHPGCDFEHCPKCGGQNISCACGDRDLLIAVPARRRCRVVKPVTH